MTEKEMEAIAATNAKIEALLITPGYRHMLQIQARNMFMKYRSYREAGFNEGEALLLVTTEAFK